MSSNPYESPPPLDSTTQLSPDTVDVVPFASGNTRANWTRALLGCGVLLSCLSILSNGWRISILDALQNKTGFNAELIRANELRHAFVALAEAVLALATIISFCTWFHRVYRNLPALGAARLYLSPGWAVGYWFIPLLNIVVPYVATTEIWRASDPLVTEVRGTLWRRAPVAFLVRFWWATWLISIVFSNFSSRLPLPTESVDKLIVAARLSIVGSVLNVLAAMLAIQLITAIDQRQTEKHALRI